MAKQLLYTDEARKKLLAGAETLVGVGLGGLRWHNRCAGASKRLSADGRRGAARGDDHDACADAGSQTHLATRSDGTFSTGISPRMTARICAGLSG